MVKVIPLTKGHVALVDDDVYETLNNFKWYYCGGYATRDIRCSGNKKKIYMHRIIFDDPSAEKVDHINGDPLDNRIQNLRAATYQQNNWNQVKRKDNKSGYKGVAWVEREKKWWAYIRHDGRCYSLKYHKTPEEAARAYNKKALELFGEFASLNKIETAS